MKNINQILKLGILVLLIVFLSCSSKRNKTILNTGTAIINTLDPSVPLKRVGLHTEADFDRVRSKVEAKEEPWISGWNRLIENPHAQITWKANPTEVLIRGGNSAEEPNPDNYSRAMNDAAAAYQLALRWRISGDNQFAQAGVNILNAWAKTCKRISGNSNTALGAGIYGYQFAVAAELLRDYEGWKADDFATYKQWMVDVFYDLNMAFLESHWGTCDSHYWANWDLCNLASVMAIGILIEDRSKYNYVVDYLQNGNGNGNLYLAINHVFDGEYEGLAQMQESGRDQGHTVMNIGLLGTIAQLAWNQGDDFFGLDDNRILKGCEYVARYNVAQLNVPFEKYVRLWSHNCSQTEIHSEVSPAGRGNVRPVWTLIYNHYVNVKGVDAYYCGLGVKSTLPEGGGGDYGPNSGGFDQLGFGTLMFTLK